MGRASIRLSKSNKGMRYRGRKVIRTYSSHCLIANLYQQQMVGEQEFGEKATFLTLPLIKKTFSVIRTNFEIIVFFPGQY